MDKTLIDIYNIRNLESVKVWDLISSNESKLLVVPCITIMYDGGKYLSLCAKDKFFDVYVRKVVEVYNDEKDHILEDSLTNPFGLRKGIDIDAHSKSILASGELEQLSSTYQFYDGKESYDHTLLFQIDEVRLLLPIIRYHVQQLFGATDKVVLIEDTITGYRDFYTLFAKVNGIDTNLTLHFVKVDEKTFDISIGGLNTKCIPVLMRIQFAKDSIRVDTGISAYGFLSSSMYFIVNGVVKEIHEVKKDGTLVLYENKDLSSVEENPYSSLAHLDSDVQLKWFLLPWGAIYGIDNAILEVSDTEKIVEMHNMYICALEDCFARREYYSKTYLRNRTVAVDSEETVLDEVVKNVTGLRLTGLDTIYAIETNFVGKGKNGYYEGYLGNKYFYHLAVSEAGIQGITRDMLKPISKEDNILSGVDLLNKGTVLKLVKGE